MGERTYAADDGWAHVAAVPDQHLDPPAGRDPGPRRAVDDDAHAGVARRLQARLDRQLWLLGRMENDPLQSPPPALPELIDLSRRMRRDSESILLLIGREPGVRQEQASSLGGVLSEAVSAAEEPRRIVVRPAPSAAVVPGAATELLHVLAELLDHATAVYPGTDISVEARVEGSGGVTVEIRAVGGARHDPDALGARRALDAAERLAQRSRSGITLHHELGGIEFGGSGLVAGVVCPSSVVVVEQLLRPVPSLPSSLRPSLGRDAPPTPQRGLDTGRGAALSGTAAAPNGSAATAGPAAPNGHGTPAGNGNGVRRLGELLSPPSTVERASGPAVELDVVSRPPARPAAEPGPAPAADLPKRSRNGSSAPLLSSPSLSSSSLSSPSLSSPNPDPARIPPVEFEKRPASPPGSAPRAPSALDMPFSDKLFSDKAFAEEAFGRRPLGAPVPGEPQRPDVPPHAGVSPASSRIDELFGPIADIPFDPASASASTPIFEAIASAWFQHGNGSAPSSPAPGPSSDTGQAQDWETPIDSEWRAAAARAARAEASPLLVTGLPRRTPGNQLVPPPRARSDESGAQRPAERIPDRIRERLSGYQRGLEQGRHRAEAAPARAEPADPEFW